MTEYLVFQFQVFCMVGWLHACFINVHLMQKSDLLHLAVVQAHIKNSWSPTTR